ncbi:MAG TPA: indolepyruvate ferredoxin oxidoreductase subunit alpha [Chloroflexi bacterium]|jgi:indolepyruvate ferredoxin oxidoreductase alpha subunit|nr:indolepyruvate ferredoxin oxidoreductase subunit alpha [Chloroflexota bacterium]
MVAPSTTTSRILRGDRALAYGALAAGVEVVTGYPGSPATGVFEGCLEGTEPGQAHVQWAPNEKVAMEIAYGASLAGRRALVVLKSVGMNIALDPLATMALSGCHAGLVILLGDDPGGWGSQNEQDSRWLARVAEVPVVEPVSVEQSAALMAQAFVWSESLGVPVIVRIVGSLALSEGPVEEPWRLPPFGSGFLRKRDRWVVLPATVVRRHHSLHRKLRQARELFEASPYDAIEGRQRGDRSLPVVGVLAVGHTLPKVRRALGADAPAQVLSLSSVWPLPDRALVRWLRGLERVLVVEEGGPFVEEQVRDLAQRHALPVVVLGRADGQAPGDGRVLPAEGELTEPAIAEGLQRLDPALEREVASTAGRAMPSRVPLCDGCPYRPTFEALIAAMDANGGRSRHIVVGETGCMVRANLPPMELFDVKYSLGSGLGLGIGLALGETAPGGRGQRVVALLGDSSFFHTDINALPYAAQLNLPMLVVLLDNATTALTGGQVHPGSATDARGAPQRAIDLADVVRGCGLEPTVIAADDVTALRAAFLEGLRKAGTRVIIARGPCPQHVP